MAFTTGNDINILQATDTAVVGAGSGNDIYILSGALVSTGQQITISDTLGSNVLRLVNGLSIVSSIVTNSIAQLTLSNNAVVKVLGANAFSFEFGGDTLTGVGATKQTFTEFVTQTLGVASVPATGTLTGGAVTIGQSPVANVINIPVATATASAPVTPVAGTAGADVFYFDAVTAKAVSPNTQVTLGNGTATGNIAAADMLRIDLPTASGVTTLAALNGQQGVTVQDNLGSYLVNFGPDANGDVVSLTLMGVTDPALVAVTVV